MATMVMMMPMATMETTVMDNDEDNGGANDGDDEDGDGDDEDGEHSLLDEQVDVLVLVIDKDCKLLFGESSMKI